MGKRENVSARFLQAAARRHPCGSGCVPSWVTQCGGRHKPAAESPRQAQTWMKHPGDFVSAAVPPGGCHLGEGMVLLCWGKTCQGV